MANVKLIFQGTENSGSSEVGLRCFVNCLDEITISVEDYDCDHTNNEQRISLDRETAIKLHRELKKQISFLGKGAYNG